jgi:mannose-6-phosphate isomerase class I
MLTGRCEYDKSPNVAAGCAGACSVGWGDILARLSGAIAAGRFVLCVECYPGAFASEIAAAIGDRLRPTVRIRTDDCFKPAAEIERMLAPYITEDRVFGKTNGIEILDFFDPVRLKEARRTIGAAGDGLIVVIGTGATLVAETWDCLAYANMARWEIQQRQRRHQIGNLGCTSAHETAAVMYKRGFLVDWRAADRLKRGLYERIDFLLDTNDARTPKMISGADFRGGLDTTVRRPFRVVPFFDPGPWGGQWMRQNFGLPEGPPNYAWGFDCVPEENSLLLGFGGTCIETPAIDLVLRCPRELLGEYVLSRFGAEFPIRFDFLDTMEGGNLSLQVHPLAPFIRRHFGMAYTQDESYYLMECGDDARVFLGLKEGVDASRFAADLRLAQSDGPPFPAERYVNVWPAHQHDHFLIPAGTVHCSGRNCAVLEISATPYIFTFKLWDWGRLGLDGEPRPIHLSHGLENIQWDRTTRWVERELINRVKLIAEEECWREECTGLHESQFIETRRHWFTGPVLHDTHDTVNVLNLVQGKCALVESPRGAFDPLVVHYAETFIVPASVGPYVVRPVPDHGEPCATVKAYVRK